MAKQEHVTKLKEGVAAWNEWRQTSDSKVDLSFIHLIGESLDFYDLTNVNLSDSRLDGVTFIGAYCSGARFDRALIFDARFRSASMDRCSFWEADIRSTTFDWCHAEKVDFTNSIFDGNTFVHISLRDALGLETIEHSSPSSIGLDTFFQS